MDSENKLKKNGYHALKARLRDGQAREQALREGVGALTARIAELEAKNAELTDLNARLTGELTAVKAQAPDYAVIAADECFIADYAARSQPLCDYVIKAYLRSLSAANNVSVLSGSTGVSVLAPPNKPQSLAEAKKMAQLIIKG